jgi:hypothetical protein
MFEHRRAGLAPGSYKLVAIPGDDLSVQGNEALGFEDRMESVELHAGDKVTRDLKRLTPESQ